MFCDSGDFKHTLNSKKSSYPVEISQLLENARPQSLMCFNDDVDQYECKKHVISKLISTLRFNPHILGQYNLQATNVFSLPKWATQKKNFLLSIVLAV